MPDITNFTFQDTVWHPLNLYPGSVTIKNQGGQPISIVINTTGVTPTDGQLLAQGVNPLEIGGLINEVSTKPNEFIFGKSASGSGSVNVRVAGTLDPSEDITYLATELNQLQVLFSNHDDARNNPHVVTKAQIGLGNIPNTISDNPADNSSARLATTKATTVIVNDLNAHEANSTNPHAVTKSQVGLGSVSNYAMANDTQAIDNTLANLYMSPKSTYAAIRAWVQIALSMKSQIVIAGQVASRLAGWSNKDCDYPSRIIEKQNNTTIKILSGLKVAFADGGKTRDSVALDADQSLALPITPTDGVYYIYCNLGTNTAFTSFGMTKNAYKEGMTRDGHVGDFYSVPENQMYDSTGTAIRRVYLGKCYVSGGIIASVIPVPIGTEIIIPVPTTIVLGGRDLYDNPFCGPVEVKAEVEYNFTWGETGWNDQIGVVAHPYPTSPNDRLILQSGLMGFVACGREAGSPFGASFAAITTAPRARLVIRKKY